ncbi:hypothetical protein MJK71_23240 [Escherichia coli]|nr:hypothetical protein MJK71_23240 [Escherichia coli]
MHIGSGVDYAHLEQVCGYYGASGHRIRSRIYRLATAAAVVSVPYQQGEEAVDTEHYYGLWNAAPVSK